ncbi:S8 family serine peptidase, partial [Aeromicrobium sp.]|uniref:S8 family serine peptidase n=1 Tax=Aeromicrobium sp. TaxID=1871063 RepID=UPI0019CF3703
MHLIRRALPSIAVIAAVVLPSAAAAADPSNWFDTLRMGANHKISTGKGVTVAVLDGSLDTSVPTLQGADISFGKGCSFTKATSLPARDDDHGTAMTSLIVGQGNGGVVGAAPNAKVRFYSIDTSP